MTKDQIFGKLENIELACRLMSTESCPAKRLGYMRMIETKIALLKAMIRDL